MAFCKYWSILNFIGRKEEICRLYSFKSSNHNIHVDGTVYEAHVLLVINVQFQFANSGNTKTSLMAFQQKLPQNCMFTCYFCVFLKLIIHVISPFNDF